MIKPRVVGYPTLDTDEPVVSVERFTTEIPKSPSLDYQVRRVTKVWL